MSVGVGEGMVGVGCGVAVRVGVGGLFSQAIDKTRASIPTSSKKPIGRTGLRCLIGRSLSRLLASKLYYLSDMIVGNRHNWDTLKRCGQRIQVAIWGFPSRNSCFRNTRRRYLRLARNSAHTASGDEPEAASNTRL